MNDDTWNSTPPERALDLRLKVRERRSDLVEKLERLPTLIADASRSRIDLSAMLGRSDDSSNLRWLRNAGTVVGRLQVKLKAIGADHTDLTPAELETKLIAIHHLANEVERYCQYYRKEVAADDKLRQRIRMSPAPLKRLPKGGG